MGSTSQWYKEYCWLEYSTHQVWPFAMHVVILALEMVNLKTLSLPLVLKTGNLQQGIKEYSLFMLGLLLILMQSMPGMNLRSIRRTTLTLMIVWILQGANKSRHYITSVAEAILLYCCLEIDIRGHGES